MIVPFVITPKLVYNADYGFFLTPNIGKLNVVLSSGWVTLHFLNLNPVGLMYLSNLGGLRVNVSGTKHTLLIFLFHAFYLRFPLFIT